MPRPSVCVRRRPLVVAAIVTQLVTQDRTQHAMVLSALRAGPSHLLFGPQLDGLSSRVKNQLRVDVDPRLAGCECRPLADEPQRPGWRQRPGPSSRVLIVRGATAATRLQDRPGRLGVTVRSSAENRAPIGELQADLVGLVSQHAAAWGLGIEAGGARVYKGGDEDFESVGVGRYAGDRDRRLVGPVKLQRFDGHDAWEFRLRRVPWSRRPTLQGRPRWR